jgi:hypothetical protein
VISSIAPRMRAALGLLTFLALLVAGSSAIGQTSPVIYSVSFSGSQNGSTNPTLTILGSGFLPEPAVSLAACGGSLFTGTQLHFRVQSLPSGGFNAGASTNLLGLVVTTYSDTSVVYRFGSGGCGYPTFGKVAQGDTFTVDVRGASCTGIVNYTSPVACSPLPPQDTTAPTVEITASPSDPTSSTLGGFDFTASDPDDSSGFAFACELDGGGFAACGDHTSGATSSASYSGLADGTHTFRVHATDSAGNTGPEATFSWRVDTHPPLLSLPADITVDATSPAGAVVVFTATSSDDDGLFYPVSCAPASGSMFPIGTTTVSCQATDAAGNTASGSFLVTVETALDQLSDLIAEVQGLGPGRSLAAKLQNVRARLRAGDTRAACNGLDSFVNEVRAQSGKSLSASEANALTSDALRVEAVIGCG